jgi:hypothetical protein
MSVTSRLGLPIPSLTDSMSANPFATTFNLLDPAIGPTFCTSSTKPSTPYACQWIYQTDINLEAIWDPTISSWVTIYPNDSGILGSSTTVNTTGISATNTKYMCGTLTSLSLEANRNYKLHVEGIFGYISTRNNNSQCQANGIAYTHQASGSSVLTSSTVIGQQYVDAWVTPSSNATAQVNFTFDTIINSGAGGTNSFGWSFQDGTSGFNPGAGSIYVQNALTYLERC